MRLYIAFVIAKAVSLVCKTLNIGAGYTWPGHIALKVYPNILYDKNLKFNKGVIYVTGTNGKTTTTKLITRVLEDQKNSVLHNTTGANLKNGIVSSIILNFSLLRGFNYDYGVFEVDEFSFFEVFTSMPSQVVVFLNLSRDQLDRHFEIEHILERWQNTLISHDSMVDVFYDPQDKHLSKLALALKRNKNLKISHFDKNFELLRVTTLKGDFNSKNVDVAQKVLNVFGIETEAIYESLKGFKSAYGRGEVVPFNGIDFHLYLAKNPASFNNNLSLINHFDPNNCAILFVLNDNIPDGRDVSWIYDIDSNELYKSFKKFDLFVSGSRHLDMSVRLKYSGLSINENNIDNELSTIVNKIVKTKKYKNVLVLPNYSAMLQVRKVLLGRSIL